MVTLINFSRFSIISSVMLVDLMELLIGIVLGICIYVVVHCVGPRCPTKMCAYTKSLLFLLYVQWSV